MTILTSRAPLAKSFLFALLISFSVQLPAQVPASPPRSDGKIQMASLRPTLVWQRSSPKPGSAMEGPVLYQLLFSTAGMPGTLAKFDTNPRHLTNSLISEDSAGIHIGGMSVNGSSGVITFANTQTFPGGGGGTVTNVATGTGLTGGPITGTGTISIANGGVGTVQMGDGSVTPAKINSGAASNGQVLTANGSGGASFLTSPALNSVSHDATLSGNGTGGTPLAVASPLSLSQASATPTLTSANTGSGNGINGTSSTGTGVVGKAAGTSGLASGAAAVLGDSGTYFGVWGTSNSNQGVVGSSNSNYGVVGTSVSGLSGIYGTGAHNGVFGQTSSAVDSGVLGRNDAAATVNQAAAGIFGFSTGGWGVLARGDDAAHGGVSAFSQNGPGIVATAATAASAAAIFNNLGGGRVFSGQNNGVEKFFVDGTGSINGGLIVQPNVTSPNILGGFSGNAVTGGVVGATIAGGGVTGASLNNRVTDDYGVVGGGQGNQAGDAAGTTSDRSYATVAGGLSNTASGKYSFVAGGNTNTASGANSFAAGFKANASMDGSIVFATGNVNPWPAFAANRFEVFATGGSCFDGNEIQGSDFVCFSVFPGQLISTSAGSPGANLTTGGVWTNASDRNSKREFKAVDMQTVLERVIALPVSQWSYKAEDPKVRHLGPMAQDFYASFGLGQDDKHIGTVDEEGVALAAIQGLNHKLEDQIRQKDAQIAVMQRDKDRQQKQIEVLQQQMRAMMQRLASVENSVKFTNKQVVALTAQ